MVVIITQLIAVPYSHHHIWEGNQEIQPIVVVIIPSYIKYIAILVLVELFSLNLTTPYLEGKINS